MMQLSHNVKLWDLSTCSDTYKRYADLINPFPDNPESIEALKNISQKILEPILSNCDCLILTYGFSSKNLLKYLLKEKAFIAPRCDQHASCEVNTRGNYYCKHKGAAVDIATELNSSKLISLFNKNYRLLIRRVGFVVPPHPTPPHSHLPTAYYGIISPPLRFAPLR